MRHLLARHLPWFSLKALHLAHRLQLLRLRLESSLGAVRPRIRIGATACWRFPIYSQTFVQQEAAALAEAGFDLRFCYAELGERAELSVSSAILWGLKRRVFLHASTGAADLAYYRRRMPDRVESLLHMLGTASGLSRESLLRHEHFLHAFAFTRAMQAWRPHYLHSYFFYEQSLFALVAAHMLGIPRGVSCYADHLLQDYALKVVPLHLRHCDILIATSARIGAELARIHGAALPSVLVKPNAIDTRSFTPRLREDRAPNGPLRLLCVSRIDPKKGLEYLIEASAALRAMGYRVETTIVGAPAPGTLDAAYDERLRARVADLGLDAEIRFAGKCGSQAVRGFLAGADLFVAPFVELENGDKDGIPTAILEAMASACPIVATDAGSITEIVGHDREAWIVPQRDGAALAAAIDHVLRTPGLSARLGGAALARARAEFDVAVCEKAFHGRIRAVVAGARAPGAGSAWQEPAAGMDMETGTETMS